MVHSKNLGEVFGAFSQVLVINLDRRSDRWDLISAHLRDQGLKRFERISGVDGHLESPDLCSRVQRLESQPKDKVTLRQHGVVGCLKGHLKALRVASTILKSEEDQLLVLEDDTFFIEAAAPMLEAGLRQLPKSWDVFMLGAVYQTAPGMISGCSKVVRVWNASATHAYVVNKRSCSLIIHHIERMLESSVIIPIDELFMSLQSEYQFYALNPLIAGQRSGDWSDIEGTTRVHTKECFKLGVEMNGKVRLWMTARPYLMFVRNRLIDYVYPLMKCCCQRLMRRN